MRQNRQNKGFTLLEILLVIAAIGILAAIVLVAINPNRQIEAARNAKRKSDINTIIKAIQQYSIDNNGQNPTGIETGAKAICNTGSQKSTDILAPANLCDNKVNLKLLVPDYLASIPEPDSNNYYVRKGNNSIEVSHPRDDIWNIGGNPSLDLNFAKNKSLIDGVSGNNLITFARNSVGTYVGADGLIKTAGVNEPRFDHNPITGESLGLLVEEQRTNSIRNNTILGAVAGTPGTLPTNWSGSAATGLTREVVGTGTENGVAYIDLKYTGTVSASRTQFVFFEPSNQIAASNGQSWTGSVWVKIVAGSLANITSVAIQADTRDASLVYVSTPFVAAFTPTSAFTRYSGTGSATGATINWILPFVQFITASSGAIDITLRIGLPQLEQGGFATSLIPTSTTAVTRNADVASITGSAFSGFYRQDEGTALQLYSHTGAAGSNNGLFNFHNSISPNNDRFTIRAGTYAVTTGGVTQATGGYSIPFANNLMKIAFAYKTDDTALMRPVEQSILSDTSVTLPTGINTLEIGKIEGTALQINGHIRRLTYWPTRLPNTTLQSLTK